MCRLMALTANAEPTHRVRILERMLLLSMCDESQVDGTGVMDGTRFWKTAAPAWLADNGWQTGLSGTHPLVGHVRKKSVGTSATRDEAHPFVYETLNGPLMLMHNGFFAGNDARKWNDAKAPNSDTYWAGITLAELLDRDAQPMLGRGIIEEWLTHFSMSSAFSLMIYYGDQLIVARGKDRPLTMFEYGDGLVINTSARVNELMREYLAATSQRLVGTEVINIPEGTLLTFSASGGRLLDTDRFEIKLKPHMVYKAPGSAWEGQTGKKDPEGEKTSAVTTTPSGTGNDGDEDTHYVMGFRAGASSSMRPVNGAPLRLPAPEKSGDVSPSIDAAQAQTLAIADAWAFMRNVFAPMRSGLLLYWLGLTLGGEYATWAGTKELLRLTTLDDLDAFMQDVVPNIDTSTDLELATKLILPLPTRRRINLWNSTVAAEDEVDAARELFGGELFWMPNYELSDDQLQSAVSVWGS